MSPCLAEPQPQVPLHTEAPATIEPPMASQHSVRGTVVRYIAERARRGEFSPYTRRTVSSILGRFTRDVGGSMSMSAVTKTQVNRWWGSLEVGPSTVRNHLSTVRTYLRWCVDQGILASDPSRHLRAPKEPRRIPRTVPAQQASQLVESLPDSRARLVVLWMLHLGLRCGEVARLEVGDIDFDARLVFVRGKGGHERMLPIPAEAWTALCAYLAEFPATSGPLVRRFDDPHRPLVAHYVSDLVRLWMRDALVKSRPRDGISGHALRRTCASDLLDGGAHVRQVQAVLGHQSLATTEKYLRRSDAGELRQVMDGRSYRS